LGFIITGLGFYGVEFRVAYQAMRGALLLSAIALSFCRTFIGCARRVIGTGTN